MGLSPRPKNSASCSGHFSPHEILGHGHAPGAIGCAVGHGAAVPFEICLDVVGGALAVTHCHDDGGPAEGPVTGGEDFVVFAVRMSSKFARTRSGSIKPRSASSSHSLCWPTAAMTMPQAMSCSLPGTTTGRRRPVLVGFAGLGAHAAKRELIAPRLHRNLLGVVDEFDAFLDGALQLDGPRRDSPQARADRQPSHACSRAAAWPHGRRPMATSPPPMTTTVSGSSGRSPGIHARAGNPRRPPRDHPVRRECPWLCPTRRRW